MPLEAISIQLITCIGVWLLYEFKRKEEREEILLPEEEKERKKERKSFFLKKKGGSSRHQELLQCSGPSDIENRQMECLTCFSLRK